MPVVPGVGGFRRARNHVVSVEDVAMINPVQHKDFCFENLINPAAAYRSPRDVVDDEDRTTNEKRAVLASWASDAHAVATSPGLRQPPIHPPIPIDEILDALKCLDGQASERPDYGKFFGRAARIKHLFRSCSDGRPRFAQ